jgi:hypothetical protein
MPTGADFDRIAATELLKKPGAMLRRAVEESDQTDPSLAFLE